MARNSRISSVVVPSVVTVGRPGLIARLRTETRRIQEKWAPDSCDRLCNQCGRQRALNLSLTCEDCFAENTDRWTGRAQNVRTEVHAYCDEPDSGELD
ncbi:hypothetical protein BH11PLA2_BH11PLA2_34510 [soil metagenome]